MSATGDLLLGINAHVQRDLPLVLYAVGLVRPDGTSRKADHDRVNVILNRVTDDILAEIARRFDPTVDDTNLPTTLDDAALFQLLAAWREKAWRNAELLATAPTPRRASWSWPRSRTTPRRRPVPSPRQRATPRSRAGALRATTSVLLTT